MRLKHQFTLLLTAIYIASMAGLAFNLHYCGGKLAEVALYKPVKPCKMCAKVAASEKEHGCCKTTVVDVKVKDDHQSGLKNFVSHSLLETTLPQWAVINWAPEFENISSIAYRTHAPPTGPPVPFTILNCVFRI